MDAEAPQLGGGRPSLPSGEPVLARWFVLLLLPLVLIGIAVTVWAFARIGRDPLSAAARRPPGTAEVTHIRGDAALNQEATTEPGPSCAEGVAVYGDAGARAAGRRALGAVCQQIEAGRFPEVAAGLDVLAANRGELRFAVFQLTGLDSSARRERGRVVVELNAKFQFEDATVAAPFVMHELAHLAATWPGEPVSAEQELRALRVQSQACDGLAFRDQPPRGCRDADEVLAADDPLAELEAAGYRRDR